MSWPYSLEILSRQRTELFLGEAERDRLAELALTPSSGRSPPHLKSRCAGFLLAVALRLEPRLLFDQGGLRTEPRVGASND